MKSINVPSANQPISCIGIAKDFGSTDTVPECVSGYVRIKNIGDYIGYVRIKDAHSPTEDDGMAFSPGETEYVYINENEQLEIIDGEFNIMW